MPPPTWSAVRDAWLEVASQAMGDDERVRGFGLVGSFGRNTADAWSDLDLLVAVDDAGFTDWTQGNDLWSEAALLFQAPQNTRRTARSVSSLYVLDDLPVGVDWYVFRTSELEWPADCHVEAGRDVASSTTLTFDEWNALGERGSPLTMHPDVELGARVSMTPIAGKYVVRRSDDASRMIEFLTGSPISDDPARQVAALEAFVRDAAHPEIVGPLLNYLALVAMDVLGQASKGA